MQQQEKRKTFEDLKPNDIVKSCRYLERGSCFELSGMHCCCLGTTLSPALITKDEINENKFNYNLIVKRRQELFMAINNNCPEAGDCLNCTNIEKKQFKDVNLNELGGTILPAGFNIQNYTMCNERCTYCCYAQENNFQPPQYNLLKVLEVFKQAGHLKPGNWIDFSGGEPAILKNFDEILTYFDENNLGTVVVYSNASIYSQKLCDLLKENKIILTTSVDTGLCSTYCKLRGLDAFPNVLENLIRYRNSGTTNMWLKYVITETNRTEDDLWSFITTMLALRPNRIMISPDFPYGDREIPQETVDFAAKLWHLLEKYLGIEAVDFTLDFGDPKFTKYHNDLAEARKKLKKEEPLSPESILKLPSTPLIDCSIKNEVPLIQKIFSIRNENKHKVIRCFGLKLKIKRGYKK